MLCLSLLQSKRRIILHSGAKDLVINQLHARVPVTPIRRNVWLNLALDIFAFSEACFPEAGFRQLDLIKLSGACKLRRIFSMLQPIYDDEFDTDQGLLDSFEQLAREDSRGVYADSNFGQVPQSMQLPAELESGQQLIFPQRLAGRAPSTAPVLSARGVGSRGAAQDQASGKKVAFGSRVNSNASSSKSSNVGVRKSTGSRLPRGQAAADSSAASSSKPSSLGGLQQSQYENAPVEELKTVPEDPFENTAQMRSVTEVPENDDPFAIYGRNAKSGIGTLATHTGTG